MAWTTRIIHVDHETSEVLTTDRLRAYDLVKTEKLINKINDTHIERVFIKLYKRSGQQTLFG